MEERGDEQCVWCLTMYNPEESDAEHKEAVCSKECESKFLEWNNKPLEFI